MKPLLMAIVAILLIFGSGGLLSHLERRGLVKKGTSKRLFSYDPSDPKDQAVAKRVLGFLVVIYIILGIVVFVLVRPTFN